MKIIFLTLIIAILFIIGCATAPFSIPKDQLPDTKKLDSSMEGLSFYTRMLIEMSDAIDILSDESLSVEDRMQLYKVKMKLIQMKMELFEAIRDK